MSGERQSGIPEISHQMRYMFATKFINEGDKVLDVFCGTGYGSRIMSTSKALSVTAFDKFNGFPHSTKINFVQATYPQVEFAKDAFDFVTFFEAIEHVDDEVGLQLLQSIRYWLKPGGQLLISTPNENVCHFEVGKFPYHFFHFTPEQLESLLIEAGFRVTNWWNQPRKFSTEINDGPEGRYMIARCI